MTIQQIRDEIIHHPSNAELLKKGWLPLFTGSPKSKIVIIGQATG